MTSGNSLTYHHSVCARLFIVVNMRSRWPSGLTGKGENPLDGRGIGEAGDDAHVRYRR